MENRFEIEPKNGQSSGYYILLADDDEDDTFLFREALDHIPLETRVTCTGNGMELMDVIEKSDTTPDIIFLDMNMPVKNGLECLDEIRATPGYEEIPVVILSTSIADYLWESAYKGGANLYVQKPTSFTGLVEILKQCLFRNLEKDSKSSLEQFLIIS